MKPSDSSFHVGHRERLRKKFLDDKLADYELLELLLTYAIPRRDVRPLSRELMKAFGNAYGVVNAPFQALVKVDGLKENTAVFIKAIHKIMLAGHKDYLADTPVFHDYSALAEYCRLMLYGKTVEEFHVLYLDSRHKMLADDLHSSGTIDWAAVYPREIVKRALDLNATAIVMVHNHPSGNSSFSHDDITTSEEIKDMLAIMNISLFDHLLVSGNIVYSAKNMFLIK